MTSIGIHVGLFCFFAACGFAQESRSAATDEILAFRREYTEALIASPDTSALTAEELEKANADTARNPALKFMPRAVALARKHLGSKEATETWSFVLTHCDGLPAAECIALRKEAVAAIKGRATEPWCNIAVRNVGEYRRVVGTKEASAVLEVARKSTHSVTAGEALLALARVQWDRGDDAGRAAARKLLQEAAEKHGQPKDYLGTIRERAERMISAMDAVQVGKPLPALDATAIGGQSVTPATTANKVVVLCFWSHSNRDFLAVKKTLEAFRKRFDPAAVLLVGVLPYYDAEEAAKRMKLEGVAWAQVADPSASAWADKWDVEAGAAHFVVADRKGIVRHAGPGAESAVKAAEAAVGK